MSESQEQGPNPHEINPEVYLNNIGPENKNNVTLLRDALQTTTQEAGIAGFMLAVGGTVEKKNPDKRKDVDIRIGLQIDNSDLINLSLLEKYQQYFERWKTILQKTVLTINKDENFEVEVDPPHQDRDHEFLAANDGMIKLIPKKGGVPIEVLCHQAGSLIKPPFVTLFSDMDLKTA